MLQVLSTDETEKADDLDNSMNSSDVNLSNYLTKEQLSLMDSYHIDVAKTQVEFYEKCIASGEYNQIYL